MWEFTVSYSNPVFLETKHIFPVFYSIYGITIKFWNSSKEKKMVIGNVFPKLGTVQGLVTPLTIQRRLKTSFDSQHVKRFQTLVKSLWGHFYNIFPSLWGEMIWKISPWLKFEIVGLFINTWTANYKYPVPVCQNLPFLFKSSCLKNKNIFLVFDSIYGVSIKFWTDSKKRRWS